MNFHYFKSIKYFLCSVLGSPGTIGGSITHEYHYVTDIGEDDLMHCKNCQHSANMELVENAKCPNCNSENISLSKGIEVCIQ